MFEECELKSIKKIEVIDLDFEEAEQVTITGVIIRLLIGGLVCI